MPVIAHPDVLFLAAVRENARRRTVIYQKDRRDVELGQKGHENSGPEFSNSAAEICTLIRLSFLS